MRQFFINKILPIIGIILFFNLVFFYGKWNNKKISNRIFDKEVAISKIKKMEGYSNSITVILEGGEKLIFAPKFNKELNCSFLKCVKVGDVVFKEKKSKLIKVVKKSRSDTLIFEIY